jgi:hypothetical protein
MDAIYEIVDYGFGEETIGYFDSVEKAEAYLRSLIADRPTLARHLDIVEIGINPEYHPLSESD